MGVVGVTRSTFQSPPQLWESEHSEVTGGREEHMARGKAKVVWRKGVRSIARPAGSKEVSGVDRSQVPRAFDV